jgi:hypothetical protein
MATEAATAGALTFIDRLPKDLIDPDARDRLRRFTERLGRVIRIDDRGRAVADRTGLEKLVGDRELFSPSVSKALRTELAEVRQRELVDEAGVVRPLSAAEIDRLPKQPSAVDIDGWAVELSPRFEGLSKLKLAVIADALQQPTEAPPAPIPAAEVPDRVKRFFKCLKENVGAFAIVVVVATIGVILAVVGLFVPPVEAAAGWILAVYGAVVGAYIIHCLTLVGFLRDD